MKASELPAVEGASHFLVRAAYRWGRGPTLERAIASAQVRRGDMVHVCRCDENAYCEDVHGDLRSSVRGDIWQGRVWSRTDITLKQVTHPVRK